MFVAHKNRFVFKSYVDTKQAIGFSLLRIRCPSFRNNGPKCVKANSVAAYLFVDRASRKWNVSARRQKSCRNQSVVELDCFLQKQNITVFC